MTSFELTNEQRQYFGLKAVSEDWYRQVLNDTMIIYFYLEKIVKVISVQYGYLEYDTDINTNDRKRLLPRTKTGKDQKLTAPKILKIKGSGIQFSGSFHGGGVSVYDNRRAVFFIKSYLEDGQILSYQDLKEWIEKYMRESPFDYFDWLKEQLRQRREHKEIKEGDIISFPVARDEYGFAIIIQSSFESEHRLLNGEVIKSNHFGRTVIILPFSFVSRTLLIDFDELIKNETLNPIEVFETAISRGGFPVISFKSLDRGAIPKIDSSRLSKYFTIPYSKTDLLNKTNLW